MRNVDKYKDELIKMANESNVVQVSYKDNIVPDETKANGLFCSKRATNWFVKWLYEDYKFKLSKVEYELLRHLRKKGYSYIVRDGSNSVYVYEKRPCRINLYWSPDDVNHNDDISLYRLSYLFQFLKWSDEEPTLIQEILDNCEVKDDD